MDRKTKYNLNQVLCIFPQLEGGITATEKIRQFLLARTKLMTPQEISIEMEIPQPTIRRALRDLLKAKHATKIKGEPLYCVTRKNQENYLLNLSSAKTI